MKKQLVLNVDDAKRLYPSAPTELKEMLEKKFGKETLVPKKITDLVKSFADVLKIHGPLEENEKILLKYNGVNQRILSAQAWFKFDLINEVLNEGKIMDFTNGEGKHYAWFDVVKDKNKPSGCGLSLHAVGYAGTNTAVGARLCFNTPELVRHAVKHFLPEYEAILIKYKQ